MRIDIDHLVLPEPEAVTLLKDEVRRLRGAIAALADQDATLSVCEGKVIVTMDATLTVEERAAVEAAARIIDGYDEEMDGFSSGAAATLRGLLDRLGGGR
jgi:hypothetical protein